MKVCVLGLGEVGLPTVKYVASMGLEVVGYDIKQEAIERTEALGIQAFKDWQKIPVSDAYIICVYAGLKNNLPDFSSIFDVCEKIHKKNLSASSKDFLVSIESTVVPGFCRKVHKEIFMGHAMLVHVPHRFWTGDTVRHGVRQPRIIGAIDNRSLEKAVDFYGRVLRIPLHKVPIIEIAEMSKVAENAYRYVQIAFAEELKMICESLEISFAEVRDACNTKWNIKIPEARDGIGGHCLPKDSRYLLSLAETAELLKGALLTDKVYRERGSEKSK
jgi:nucleotide sugar dehydrogenase